MGSARPILNRYSKSKAITFSEAVKTHYVATPQSSQNPLRHGFTVKSHYVGFVVSSNAKVGTRNGFCQLKMNDITDENE